MLQERHRKAHNVEYYKVPSTGGNIYIYTHIYTHIYIHIYIYRTFNDIYSHEMHGSKT